MAGTGTECADNRAQKVVVIGAGVGGLVAAALLAARGLDVTLCERMPYPGGKMRTVAVAGQPVDAGPTVFTLKDLFAEICTELGTSLDRLVRLKPAQILARHAWPDGSRLDLHADPAATAAAVAAFAGAQEAERHTAFLHEAAQIHATLDQHFMRREKVGPLGLTWRLGLRRLPELQAVRPYESLWSALCGRFRDPRLIQLYGRYATYAGSSPFKAPATLMLIAHVESQGVWMVEGGMHRFAQALADLAVAKGVRLRLGCGVREILTEGGHVSGVVTEDGTRIAAAAVIANADPSAFAAGLFGPSVRRAVRAVPHAARSLSALTWMAVARMSGFPLVRHNVFFSQDYRREFTDLARGALPEDPTIYVCAQDRDCDGVAPSGPERLQIIVNAPASDSPLSKQEIERCEQRMRNSLQRSGLCVQWQSDAMVLATPTDYAHLFPSTGGALYGRASHGWAASFLRPGSRTRIPGLYLAGGATHPGAGVPMAALSGRLASAALMADRASTRASHPAAMPGGMSMPSATTATMG